MIQIIQRAIVGIVLMLSISTILSSQDRVILKQGEPITGKLIKYEIGGYVVIQTEGDTQVFIPTNEIRTILDDGQVLYGKSKPTKTKPPKVREPLPTDRWYFDWQNKLYFNNTDSGVGISLSYLYQWKHFLAAGVGIGYDNYNFNQMRSFVPLYIQARSYVKDAHKSPYLDVKLGYGIASSKSQQIISNQGGFYSQTSVGVRFGSGGFRTTIGVGLQLQENELEAIHPWNGGIVREDRQYRRIVFNLGFLF